MLEQHTAKVEQILHSYKSIHPHSAPLTREVNINVTNNDTTITNSDTNGTTSNHMCTVTTLTSERLSEYACGLKSGSDFEPMVYQSWIQSSVSGPGHGIVYFSIEPHQNPTRSPLPPKYQAIGFNRIFTRQTDAYLQQLVMFNDSARTKEELVSRQTFQDLYRQQSLQPSPLSEKQVMKELHSARGERRSALYARDMEYHNNWTDKDSNPTSERKANKALETIAIKRDWQGYEFPNYSELLTNSIQNPLNTNLFSHHPASLLSLLPRFTVVPKPSGSPEWSPCSFSGVDRPFSYASVNGNFFHLHREQMMFPFWNACWSGEKIWYLIPESEQQKLERYVIQEYKCRNPHLAPTSEREDRLLLALLYAKHTCFFDPEDLIAHGIQVLRVVQRENEVITARGTVFHWGVTAHHYAINEAINYVPINWLVSGLPQLLIYIQWLMEYVRYKPACMHSQLRSILNGRIEGLLAHNVPRVWALAFIHYVREDLQLFVSGNKSKLMYDFTEIQCTQIVTNLEALELELNKVELIQFYGQYED
jgi:hypothetical protein